MSISATGGPSANLAPPPATNRVGANDSASSSSSSSSSATLVTKVTKTVTETNSDGSVTTITTYGDGSTTTRTTPAPPTRTGPGSSGLLDARNFAQGNVLLAAQAQATTGG